MPLYTMLRRQARLLALWSHYVATCIFVSVTIGVATSNFKDPEVYVVEYILCVLENGGPSGCHQLTEAAPVPFGVVYCYVLFTYSFPISVFLLIGFRTQLILFWWEYAKEILKTKRIPVPFVPYFDTSSISTSG